MKEVTRRQFLVTTAAALAFKKSAVPEVPSAYTHLRHWDLGEVQKYSEWVRNIYEFKSQGTSKQKQARIHRIFSDDEMNLLNHEEFLEQGNPQLSNSGLNLFNSQCHCGSFPKLLKLYYSYRRGLPSAITKIRPGKPGDIRVTPGNHPVKVISSMPFQGDFRDFILDGMSSRKGGYNFISGNFRTSPDLEETDSVPIEINRKFIIPGAFGYNVNGHCLVIGKVNDSGEINFLDSHPDRSITSSQTLSALSYINASFTEDPKKWHDGIRSLRLAKIQDGNVVYFSNKEMKQFGFSSEQYTTMRKIKEEKENGGLEINGQKVTNFQQFIRARLQQGVEEPSSFLEISTQELANMFREREAFIKQTWQNVLTNGPITFPNESSSENIYQANGRWETWSSPSSDIDRKQKYNYLATRLEEMVEGFPDNESFDYQKFPSKKEMVEELIKMKNALFSQEILFYTNSQGEEVALKLLDIEQRLFDLSFDPNHCPELRWGAPETSHERNNMKLVRTPFRTGESLGTLESYKQEQGLRYVPHRQTTPTSLSSEENPTNPPFKLINQRLESLLTQTPITQEAQADNHEN